MTRRNLFSSIAAIFAAVFAKRPTFNHSIKGLHWQAIIEDDVSSGPYPKMPMPSVQGVQLLLERQRQYMQLYTMGSPYYKINWHLGTSVSDRVTHDASD